MLLAVLLPILAFLIGFNLHRLRYAGTYCEARAARVELGVLVVLFVAVSLVWVLS